LPSADQEAPVTVAEWRAYQVASDNAARRCIARHVAGTMTRDDMDCRLSLHARLWTAAENEIAAIQAGRR